MHVTAIVLAAGAGRRIGGTPAKIYLPIAGRPMVLRTLDRMFAAKSVTEVVLVAAAADLDHCEQLLKADASLSHRPYRLQRGGATRQQSAKRGLEEVGADTDIVVIHDGARPFVAPALIDRCVEAAAEKGAVVVGLPVRDTVKVIGADGVVRATPERHTLWEIQTPQAFHRQLIIAAHQQAERDSIEATDDATMVERLGRPVYVLEGERSNFKITVPEDLWLAEMMIREKRVD